MTIATEEPVGLAPVAEPQAAIPVEIVSLTPPEPRRFLHWTGFVLGWIGIILMLAGYSYFIKTHYVAAISEPDDNGYFAQGTLLAQTGRTWFAAASDAQYIGMHWLITPTATYVSRYPPGLPVLIAVVYKLWGSGAAGWRAAAWINPVLSVLTLAGFFMLTRRVLSAWWGLVGVAVLGANPTFIHHALDGDSHMGVAFVVVWGLYMLMVWRDGGKLWQVFIAGLFLGCIPPVRYGDSVMAIGIGIFFLWHWRTFPKIWKHYAMACAGAAIPIVPLLIRNQLVMGAFWRTGYSLTNEETGFSMEYFKEHAIDYVHQINGNAIGVIFALGFAGMVCMIFKSGQRKNRPLGIMLLLMSAGMLLLYMAYYWAPQGNPQSTLRFLLPSYALYILAGLWLLREAAGSKAFVAQVVLGLALVALQMVWGNTEFFQEVDQLHYQHQALNLVTTALENTAKPGDVVVPTGSLLQHLDFVREWKVADESLLNGSAGGLGGGGPPAGGPGGAGGGFGGGRGGGGGFGNGALGGGGGRRGGAGGAGGGGGFGGGRGGAAADPNAPSPRQADKTIEEREKYAGTVGQRQHKFVLDMINWAGPGHKIYIVGAEAAVRAWNGIADGTLKVVKVIQLPEQPEEPADGNGGGFGGRGGGGRGGGAGVGGGGGGGRRGGGGGGGGPMGGFAGETEIVIGEFTPPK